MTVVSDRQSRSRVRSGDVFEIKTERGWGYFQFTIKHPDMGQLIRVLPGVHQNRLDDIAKLVSEKESYYVFFPVSGALAKKLIGRIGNFSVPIWAKDIPLMRSAGARARDGKVLTWVIVSNRDEKIVKTLSESQRHLSLAVIWNDTLLAERIASGWKPADDI